MLNSLWIDNYLILGSRQIHQSSGRPKLNSDPQMSQNAPRPGRTPTSPNSDRAAGGRDHQWWHRELTFRRREIPSYLSGDDLFSKIFVCQRASSRRLTHARIVTSHACSQPSRIRRALGGSRWNVLNRRMEDIVGVILPLEFEQALIVGPKGQRNTLTCCCCMILV